MTPLDYYYEKCNQGLIAEDPYQLQALHYFQQIYTDLIKEHDKRQSWTSILRKPHLIKGLYVWGGVGIGKTFLMDCFYHCLPFSQKRRMHFYQFMRWVHEELKKNQGHKNPLDLIVKQLAKDVMVICFDELFVKDIVDAMLLGRLFKALFAEGITLIATSNLAPDDLYKNGLQREQFLPAIELLKKNTSVIYIPTIIDYRLRHLKNAGVFYIPNDENAKKNLEKSFNLLVDGNLVSYSPIDICDRHIPIKKQADEVVWFEFDVICHTPRSQQDYLAISEKYKTVIISDIPVISPYAKDTIALFIRLVDVFYDAHTRLIISAAAKIEDLYTQGPMLFDYTRTCSRLLEMQSEAYFSQGLQASEG